MSSNSRRLFFALWPDDKVRQQIAAYALPSCQSCHGRVLQSHNWHITLAYFGAANPATQSCLEQHAVNIQCHPFELQLGKMGYWKKPAVAWLAPVSIPASLQQLAQNLQQAIVPCGYTPETRQYQPHVTLVRKAKHAPTADEIVPVHWQVADFCLVESVTAAQGAEYSVLKRWKF